MSAAIKTWQERAGLAADFKYTTRNGVEDAMAAEIADLRAVLRAPVQAQGVAATAENAGDLLDGLQATATALQKFKSDWMRVPHFADRVNKATRDAISMAIGPMVNLDAVGGPLDLSKYARPAAVGSGDLSSAAALAQAQQPADAGLYAAVARLIKAKGRYHTEQNYKAVVAAFDAAKPAQQDDARDAARYRWLCERCGTTKLPCFLEGILNVGYIADGKSEIDEVIDAGIAALTGSAK